MSITCVNLTQLNFFMEYTEGATIGSRESAVSYTGVDPGEWTPHIVLSRDPSKLGTNTWCLTTRSA